MKTLHLLRHAKSSWSASGVADHDRDLNDRGRRDAPRMGAALAEICPAQTAFVSSALRAQRTLQGICDGWPALRAMEHVTVPELYTFDAREVMAWLRVVDDSAERCLIIGHNPALTDLCNEICGRPALDNLPTAGYLELSLQIDSWGDLGADVGDITRWLFPRDLPSSD